jgi:hypothetical protein
VPGDHVRGNRSQVTVKGLKKDCCVSDEMVGRGGEKNTGYVSSEHESVSSECEIEDGNCKDSEAETGNRNGEQCDW